MNSSAVTSSKVLISRSGLRYRKIRDRIIETFLLAAGLVAVFTTLAIVAILLIESAAFFEHVSLKEFLTGTMWTPLFADARYGILPLVAGTLTTTIVALLVAVPVGTIIAIYLSEFAPHRVRETVKPVLELLGAVPTVVYGYFALMAVTPLLQKLMPELPGFNMLSAGLVIGIMIVPYVSSVSEDAMRAVPVRLRHGHRTHQTALEGILPETYLRRLIDTDLQPIPIPREGVVMAERLAEILGVAPGDVVEVEVLEGSRRTRRVPVVGLTRQFFGLGAYMDLRALNRLVGDGQAISGVLLTVDTRYEDELLDALRRRPRVAGLIIQMISRILIDAIFRYDDRLLWLKIFVHAG